MTKTIANLYKSTKPISFLTLKMYKNDKHATQYKSENKGFFQF